MSRRLLVTRRVIPLDRLEEYQAGWESLLAVAHEAGGRAWMFRRVGHQDHFLEFLEWREDGAPALPERPDVARSLRGMDDTFGPGTVNEWEEVQTP